VREGKRQLEQHRWEADLNRTWTSSAA